MSEPMMPNDDRQRRLEEAMAEFLIAAGSGRPHERGPFPAPDPDLRAELVEFLAGLSALAVLVEPLLPAVAAPLVPASATEPDTTLLLTGIATTGGAMAPDPGATTDRDPSTDAG